MPGISCFRKPASTKSSRFSNGLRGKVDRNITREEIAKFLSDKRRRGHVNANGCLPFGRYYPTTLVLNCVKDRFNRHMIPVKDYERKFNALTQEGNYWHGKIEKHPIWDATEVPARKRIKTADGSYLTISGRADAILDDCVVEFKRTGWVPERKPKFEHVLQVQFYMKALGLPMARIIYIPDYGDIVDHYVTLSDWHVNMLVNRALELHTLLKHQEVPQCQCRSKIHDHFYLQYLSERRKK